MHLEIDKLYFHGNRIGIDFEYDEDFCKKVALQLGREQITKKELQFYIINIIKENISAEEFLSIKKQLQNHN